MTKKQQVRDRMLQAKNNIENLLKTGTNPSFFFCMIDDPKSDSCDLIASGDVQILLPEILSAAAMIAVMAKIDPREVLSRYREALEFHTNEDGFFLDDTSN